jgi:hypothetical protein
MKTKTYFFRLIIALIALVIGLGVYRIVERFQHSFEEKDACLNQPQNAIPIAPKEQPAETAPIQEDLQDLAFYPDGEYYPWEEHMPDGFKNFDELTIETQDWSNISKDTLPRATLPNGMIKAGREYNFAKVSINNRDIFFETESINGIKFTFFGNFPEDVGDETDHPINLRGVLTKYKNGKVVAKHSFDFFVPDC